MAVDLPEGDCRMLRDGMLDWLRRAELLDSAALAGHLAQNGMQDAMAWAVQTPGLCAEAHPTAQPKEALDGWWHFFGLLRGEAELIEDRTEAQRLLVERNDPVAQQRLIRLSEALAALRGGESDAAAEDSSLGGAPAGVPMGSEAARDDTIG